jgi:hypothetical protein
VLCLKQFVYIFLNIYRTLKCFKQNRNAEKITWQLYILAYLSFIIQINKNRIIRKRWLIEQILCRRIERWFKPQVRNGIHCYSKCNGKFNRKPLQFNLYLKPINLCLVSLETSVFIWSSRDRFYSLKVLKIITKCITKS